MKKFFIKTFGCQMNVNDSEKIAGILAENGYVKTDSIEEADVIVVNTCSVRAKPDNKAFSFIGELKKIKKKKTEAVVVVTGCVPQKDADYIVNKYPYVDILMGTFNFFKVSEFLEKAIKGEKVKEIVNHYFEDEGKIIPSISPYLNNPYIGYVTIQRGCNRFCTYCIVPYVRGRERSVPPEEILKEVQGLAARGVKEIHLLGQNVDFYKYDKYTLSDILYMVAEVDGIERIRFTTSHPAGFDYSIVKAIKEIPKVCEYVHLPPQSGSNRILEKMNRGYTREEYLEKIDMLKTEVPDIAISGDFIVGFPGETEKDFEETVSLIESVKYDQAFVFEYSPRPLTKAFKFKDDVSKEEKNRRLRIINEILKKQALKKNEKLKGEDVEILVEGISSNNPDKLTGRTRTNKIAIIDRDDSLIGKLITVEIDEVTPFYLIGKIKQPAGV
ncbi:tRNA (N6-isopentenyl adenosine(37)-C2)-methylthiotransferase MiaB [Desulfurobacterium atlanticum]|uniref:tRNA-2-methylthio-N(6)-dimethylallyladenosine synthase n=1 Tax=Desulfurobacterium atlanticum TaxID=240169 RepID=A0A239A2W9_9BACT|nr:tRNA (N6-isopentenyl adenosine(37)-C2)-methylthiotransferase MiaB [Desulfurobacterium atlanticum]SNR89354.1 tRNA-2-methylthio-N6-dimethylallyladenosine synthase [Desulfurobacterium atlanticum]